MLKIRNLEELLETKVPLKMVGRTLVTLRVIKGDAVWEKVKKKTQFGEDTYKLLNEYIDEPDHAIVIVSTDLQFVANEKDMEIMDEKVCLEVLQPFLLPHYFYRLPITICRFLPEKAFHISMH